MKGKRNTSAGAPKRSDGRAMLVAAVQHLQAGRLTEARAAYRAVLSAEPRNALALHHLGIVEHQLGRSEEGAELIRRALVLQPRSAHAHSDLAVILMAQRRDGEAIEACRKAIALDGRFAAAHGNLGDLMLRGGDYEAAERAYARAVELQPDFATAHAGLAEALAALDRLDEAEAACDTAIRLAPRLAQAHGARGHILYLRDKFADAIAVFEHALRLDPTFALIHTRLGNALQADGRLDDALAAHTRAIDADPDCAEAHCNKGIVCQSLGQFDEAFVGYSRALALRPDFADALTNLGLLLHRTGRYEEALATLKRAVALAPQSPAAHLNLAGVLVELEQRAEAAGVYRKLLALGNKPSPAGLYEYCHLRRHFCDWDGLEAEERRAIAALKTEGVRMPPFAALAMACSPEDHLALARLWASGFKPAAAPAILPTGAGPDARRIRLGYLSADFFEHATASLIAELFEQHDRTHFEVFGYCFSPDDGSAMRKRLIASFDRFAILRERSHTQAARQIAADGVDILMDLKGYTRGARTMILAQRPAPIQVNYLGYPSTMGAPFIDYIIADPFIAPMEHQRFFDEKIVHLPDCYQPNDRLRRTADPARTRSDCGLPQEGFVFCAFNNTYKITSEFFSVWMRLLRATPGSVLWLLDGGDIARANLRREAAARGIDPDRLVFAAKLHIAEHQARYHLADLFLDNLPVNAHTTASEALRAGVPVLTCAGEVFVGRVAGSLLRVCGLPELVTNSLAEYEALALRLAADRALLAGFRRRLAETKPTAPLFDTERYARNLETAFMHMVRLHERGSPPEAFAVSGLQTADAGG
jgi:predicted O-linked N-acetylglucosamine transferase (SPINDLY family)